MSKGGMPYRKLLITYQGKTMCITQWGRHLGIDPSTIRKRIYRGESFEQAISPTRSRPRPVGYYTPKEKQKCFSCIYHWSPNTSHTVYCEYILHTGKRRNCPLNECDKYEQGSPPKQKKPALAIGKERMRVINDRSRNKRLKRKGDKVSTETHKPRSDSAQGSKSSL